MQDMQTLSDSASEEGPRLRLVLPSALARRFRAAESREEIHSKSTARAGGAAVGDRGLFFWFSSVSDELALSSVGAAFGSGSLRASTGASAAGVGYWLRIAAAGGERSALGDATLDGKRRCSRRPRRRLST